MKSGLSGRLLLISVYCGILLAAALISGAHLFSIAELRSLGLRMVLRDRIIPPKKCTSIVLIKIDRASTEPGHLGRFPWNRDVYAVLIDRLKDHAAVIAFDLILSYDDPAHDRILAKAVKGSRKVVFAVGCEPSEEGKLVFRPVARALQDAELPAGSIIIPQSPEERIISIASMVRGLMPGEHDISRSMLAFEIEILKALRGSQEVRFHSTCLQVGEERIPFNRSYSFRDRKDSSFLGPFLINYRGTPHQAFDSYSFADVHEGRIPPHRFRNAAVLVVNTIDPNDTFATTRGDHISGGEIHAFALRTLMDRDYIRTTSPLVKLLIFMVLSLSALLILTRTSRRIRAALIIVLMLCLYGTACFIAFICCSLWLPLAYPVTGAVMTVLGYYIVEHHAFKKTLGALLPASFLKRLDVIRNEPRLGGKPVWASVLFADIRGYTNLSETLSSVEVMDLLNEYHQLVRKPIEENGGETFDFQGDAYMVVFGADEKQKDHAARAIRTSLALVEIAQGLKKRWEEEKGHTFDIGVGICTGEVALGYLGEGMKLTPAAIGDTTNVAARLQGKSSEFNTPVLMTETTAREAGDAFPLRELSSVALKGKREKLAVFTVDWEKLPSQNA